MTVPISAPQEMGTVMHVPMSELSRRRYLLAGLTAPLEWALSAQSLVARLEGNLLHVAAPQLRFLTGTALEQLHNGAPVAFDAQLSVSANANVSVLARAVDRFVVSYDLWEENFSVTTTTKDRRSASHLSETAAENWCFNALALAGSVLPADRPFWLRLELRVEDPKDQSGPLEGSALSLARLIEIFSRRTRAQQPAWQAEAGPLRLADLKKAS